MNIRREMAAEELEGAVKVLSHWIEKLKNPPPQPVRDGLGQVTNYVDITPEGASVGRTLAEGDEYMMLRGELMAIAAKLEGLAST